MSHKLYKNKNLLRKQSEEQYRSKADLVLRAAKAKQGNVRDLIEAAFKVFNGSTGFAGEIQRCAWHQGFSQRTAFKSLLLAVEDASDLLEDGDKTYLDALSRLASWSTFWLRQPSEWKVRSHNKGRQLASLARHLLCNYHVPTFMDYAWTGDRAGPISAGVDICQEWFIHIGTGSNIRKADRLPFPLTKMMAHHFLQAPNQCIPREALRWGQIRGMGGNERLAKAIIGSRLGHIDGYYEDFWLTVINFFIRHSDMLDMSQVGPMIDYLHNQKFVPLGQVAMNGTFQYMGPPQPHLSMEKRNIEALMNQTEAWHRQLAKAKDSKHLFWQPCGIEGFDRIEGTEGNQRRWLVEELLSSKELAVEGRTMSHCVYSYGRSCYEGRTAIYSLKGDMGNGLERRLTIEVDPKTRLITQARSRFNKPASELDKRIMSAWASKARLTYSRYATQRWA